MEEAKSDLVSLLSSLEAHWHALESEVVEVSRDAEYCEQCLRKYGECFSAPMHSLRELKRFKKKKMKDIIRSMESFNENLQGGKVLVKTLERNASPVSMRQPSSTPPAASTLAVALEEAPAAALEINGGSGCQGGEAEMRTHVIKPVEQ